MFLHRIKRDRASLVAALTFSLLAKPSCCCSKLCWLIGLAKSCRSLSLCWDMWRIKLHWRFSRKQKQMSVIRLGRSLFRSLFKQLPELKGKNIDYFLWCVRLWSWRAFVLSRLRFRWFDWTAFQASGRVPAKSGLSSRGEVRDGNCTPAALLTSRFSQNNARVFSRSVWGGLTSRAEYLANTQAALLRSKETLPCSSKFILPRLFLTLQLSEVLNSTSDCV